MNGRRCIDASKRAEIGCRAAITAGLQISADVGDGLDLQAQELAILGQSKGRFRHIVARLRIGQKTFRAGRCPFDRTADDFGRKERERDFIIDARLHAEGAANIAGNHMHFAFRHA